MTAGFTIPIFLVLIETTTQIGLHAFSIHRDDDATLGQSETVQFTTTTWPLALATLLSLVTVVALCLCCYRRSSSDDSDSDDQSKCSADDHATNEGTTSRQERKQLTLSQQSPRTIKRPVGGISFPWPSTERTIAVKSVQPDQFGLSLLNKSLGVTSPLSISSPQGIAPNRINLGIEYSEGLLVPPAASTPDSASDVGYGESSSSLFIPVGPQLGRIQIRLGYDFQQMTLTLKLINAINLPAKDFSGTSDPYVKIYLLPDRKHKMQSNIKRKCLNPQWNEIFTFEGFPYSKLITKSIYMQVLDYDRFSRDDPIGEVLLPLNDSINLINGETIWRDLQPCKGHVGLLGELLISLSYHPTQATVTVIIVKARHLKAKDLNGLSDPYVKLWLQHDGKKVAKKKTRMLQKTLNPEYNETFVFEVPYEHIRHTSLMISVMDHDFIGANELIGQVLLGCKSSPPETKHWNEMLTRPRQVVEKWHVLKILG